MGGERECGAAAPASDELGREQLALVLGRAVRVQETVERADPRLVPAQPDVGAVSSEDIGLRGRMLSRHRPTTPSVFPAPESERALRLLAEKFPGTSGATARVVVAAPMGHDLDEARYQKLLRPTLRLVREVPQSEAGLATTGRSQRDLAYSVGDWVVKAGTVLLGGTRHLARRPTPYLLAVRWRSRLTTIRVRAPASVSAPPQLDQPLRHQ